MASEPIIGIYIFHFMLDRIDKDADNDNYNIHIMLIWLL